MRGGLPYEVLPSGPGCFLLQIQLVLQNPAHGGQENSSGDEHDGAGGEHGAVGVDVDRIHQGLDEPVGEHPAIYVGDEDIQPDKGGHADEPPVSGKQVPHGHSQVHHRNKEHDEGEDHQTELGHQGQGAGVLHNAPEDIRPKGELHQLKPVHRGHDEGGQKGHHPAAYPGDGPADQLGGHQLPGPDGQGVHQIALAAQQPLGEAVDHKDDSDDEHGRDHGHKGKNCNARGGGIAKANSVVIHIPENAEPICQRQGQGRPPDQGKLLPHGPEVVF